MTPVGVLCSSCASGLKIDFEKSCCEHCSTRVADFPPLISATGTIVPLQNYCGNFMFAECRFRSNFAGNSTKIFAEK